MPAFDHTGCLDYVTGPRASTRQRAAVLRLLAVATVTAAVTSVTEAARGENHDYWLLQHLDLASHGAANHAANALESQGLLTSHLGRCACGPC